MSIQILSDSFNEHRTIDSIEVTTRYLMDTNDYYNGYGYLYSSEWVFWSEIFLPWEGDNYGLYYNTHYLADCILVDISIENTQAVTTSSVNEGTDYSGFDRHKKVIVTYTWSNAGAVDTRRKNEASSWKISYDTSLESKNVDTYISTSNSIKYNWNHQYLTAKNPNIKMTITNAEGEDEEKDYGPFNSADDALQQRYIDTIKDDLPILEMREPHSTCTVTTYGNFIKGGSLATYVGSVNSTDFLHYVYTKREEALIVKNKLKGYDSNDWFNQNDTGMWMFIDWEMEDIGSSFFEYKFTFEYNKNKWNYYFEYVDGGAGDITLTPNLYEPVDFMTTIFSGMDIAAPNERS